MNIYVRITIAKDVRLDIDYENLRLSSGWKSEDLLTA